MNLNNKYYIKISPENLKSDIFQETYSGNTFGVYSGMSYVLSGNTNGSSFLTGLTIPVIFNQTFDDLGYYTSFDGFILQKDVVNNFLYSANTTTPYTVHIYNTSDSLKKFLELANYDIDWGDGYIEELNTTTPDSLQHQYNPVASGYTITVTQKNPWGVTKIQKTIHVPFEEIIINNPLGNITFTPMGGNWSGTPIDYNFIFTGDSENTIPQQISSNFTNTPFVVSGYTNSKITNLKLYGPVLYNEGTMIKKYGQDYGYIDEITEEYTKYVIEGVTYYDLPNDTTLFFMESYGITDDMIVSEPITKEEILIGIVSSPEIQSEIFIERGKNSGLEQLQRLGEVDNMEELVSYGYGFFKINKV